MKPREILSFMLIVFAVLALLGYIIPEKGIRCFVTVKFPSPAKVFQIKDKPKISLEEYLNNVYKKYQLNRIATIEESLQFYLDFHQNNPTAICYPDDDLTYFDRFFDALDSAKIKNEVVRILHYGDSQIEGDRISGKLRASLQKHFGGMGFGLIPAIQVIPSMAVFQNYSGIMDRYCMFGVETQWASHRRYGLLAQVIQLWGEGSISVSKSNLAIEPSNQFQQVRLLWGHNQGPFAATLTINGVQHQTKTTNDSVKGLMIYQWILNKPASSATIHMSGIAEIYGIAFDGLYGVAIDNVPMRGSAGTVFTSINKQHLIECYKKMNVRMIILQYGGNVMPAVRGLQSIEFYTESIRKEIQFLKEANPDAVFLFIGPSDMSKNINGTIRTWPFLPEMNDALKKTCHEMGIAYWDMFHAMGGENSMIQWVNAYPPLAAPDYIHFTTLGTQKIAELLYNALMNDYYAYTLRKKIKTIQKDTIFKRT